MIGTVRAVMHAFTAVTTKTASAVVKTTDGLERSLDAALLELEAAKYQREVELANELAKLNPDQQTMSAFEAWKASRRLS